MAGEGIAVGPVGGGREHGSRRWHHALGHAGSGLIGLGTGAAINDLSGVGPRLVAVSLLSGFLLLAANRLRAMPTSYLHRAVVWASAAGAVACCCSIGFGSTAWRPYLVCATVTLTLIVAFLPRKTVWAMTMLALVFGAGGASLGVFAQQRALDAIAQHQSWIQVPGTGLVLAIFLVLPTSLVWGKRAAAVALLFGAACGLAIAVAYGARHDYVRVFMITGIAVSSTVTGGIWLQGSRAYVWLNRAWDWLSAERPGREPRSE